MKAEAATLPPTPLAAETSAWLDLRGDHHPGFLPVAFPLTVGAARRCLYDLALEDRRIASPSSCGWWEASGGHARDGE